MQINTASFHPAVAYSRLASAAQQPVEASNLPTDKVTLSDSDSADKPSMLSYIAKGALYGAAAGVLIPGIVVPLVGFAAAPITGPLGLVMGAFAGASAYGHPDYAPN
jgi:hypothetical protein